ncbi:hypothetical protein FCM35_KLT11744 [Carex littledalei]|uniref:VHS domain-containing protein n=1 Tax=Carex littledalei TaxID=544730 RepID=A0A833QKX5_9POAL|nr:hypothetical protein FCM35_KLT11744 [Carex littledalei]
MIKQQPRVQYLALVLLEACVKNCQRGFADVAADGVLDEMVQVVDDPETVVNVRNKVLVLIEAWGESGKLCYLPVYEVIYMSLISRGIQFPRRDDESLAPVFTPSHTVPEETFILMHYIQQVMKRHLFIVLLPSKPRKSFLWPTTPLSFFPLCDLPLRQTY